MTTTYNSSHVNLDIAAQSPLAFIYDRLPGPKPEAGHPAEALTLGDVLGLDGMSRPRPPPPRPTRRRRRTDEVNLYTRINWKSDALRYWNDQAASRDKQLWITEMQAAPWVGTKTFATEDLEERAVEYGPPGPPVILLWGSGGLADLARMDGRRSQGDRPHAPGPGDRAGRWGLEPSSTSTTEPDRSPRLTAAEPSRRATST